VYRAIQGSNPAFEFQARRPRAGASEVPQICWRRLVCRCEPCRDAQQGAPAEDCNCVMTTETGRWKATNVSFVSVLDISATQAKKAAAKARRASTQVAQVARLVALAANFQANPESAPSPQAAVAAADQVGARPAAQEPPAFTAACGSEDARAVAVARGDIEFLYQRATESSGEEEEAEEGE